MYICIYHIYKLNNMLGCNPIQWPARFWSVPIPPSPPPKKKEQSHLVRHHEAIKPLIVNIWACGARVERLRFVEQWTVNENTNSVGNNNNNNNNSNSNNNNNNKTTNMASTWHWVLQREKPGRPHNPLHLGKWTPKPRGEWRRKRVAQHSNNNPKKNICSTYVSNVCSLSQLQICN